MRQQTSSADRARVPADPVAEEDRLRAYAYGLLSRLLARPPSQALIDEVKTLSGDASDLGRAFTGLAAAAAGGDIRTIGREYHALFIGVGRGELLPYASYYLTGFVHGKPLASLRSAMLTLGIARDPAFKDPEDHICALMGMMAGLIGGAFGAPAALDVQRSFFTAHVAPWATHFFADLEGAAAADFYRPVGTIGRLLMEIEETAFRMI
ncbi:MAG: molecular chaperone TorD family protein [Rhodospirillaceae bacterium]|nr:molecular chaperone TorD family protein [Rhodospirillaceae bacterium]